MARSYGPSISHGRDNDAEDRCNFQGGSVGRRHTQMSMFHWRRPGALDVIVGKGWVVGFLSKIVQESFTLINGVCCMLAE